MSLFKDAFASRFGNSVYWTGGQIAGNVAQLPGIAELCRGGVLHRMEQFEIGDLRGNYNGRTLVIEYEQKQLPLSNLVKYWPYVRGELNVKPECPIVLCHFSNWWSYGTYRDLWNWVMLRMEPTPNESWIFPDINSIMVALTLRCANLAFVPPLIGLHTYARLTHRPPDKQIVGTRAARAVL